LEILRVFSQHENLERIRKMPSLLTQSFHDALSTYPGSFVQGIGAMVFTNFAMKFPNSCEDTTKTGHRILPPLSASEADIALLRPEGIHHNVVQDVSPYHTALLREISRLWPDLGPQQASGKGSHKATESAKMSLCTSFQVDAVAETKKVRVRMGTDGFSGILSDPRSKRRTTAQSKTTVGAADSSAVSPESECDPP